eukprot:scaffold234736_cov36-Tisochrysis_lutea.AAC.1
MLMLWNCRASIPKRPPDNLIHDGKLASLTPNMYGAALPHLFCACTIKHGSWLVNIRTALIGKQLGASAAAKLVLLPVLPCYRYRFRDTANVACYLAGLASLTSAHLGQSLLVAGPGEKPALLQHGHHTHCHQNIGRGSLVGR